MSQDLSTDALEESLQDEGFWSDMLSALPENIEEQFLLAHSIEELPEEILPLFSSIQDFSNAISTIENLCSLNLSAEQMVIELSKQPNGLELYESLMTSRTKMWANNAKMFLLIFEGTEDLDMAKRLANCNSFDDILSMLNLKSKIDTKNIFPSLYNKFFANFSAEQNEYLFKLFKSVISCQFAGLPEQANLFIDQLTNELLLYQNRSFQQSKTTLLKNQGHRELSAISGKKGNQTRHQASAKTKASAIELYQQGSFKNPSQAAEKLFPQVKALGEKYGFHFASNFNGQRTLYNWLRASKQ